VTTHPYSDCYKWRAGVLNDAEIRDSIIFRYPIAPAMSFFRITMLSVCDVIEHHG